MGVPGTMACRRRDLAAAAVVGVEDSEVGVDEVDDSTEDDDRRGSFSSSSTITWRMSPFFLVLACNRPESDDEGVGLRARVRG